MVSLQEFSELLGVLYSAPLDQVQWERFLALLSQRTQSRLAVFLCADGRLGISCLAHGGNIPSDRVNVLAYNQRYAGSDPFRAPCLRNPRPRIVQGDDLLPNQGLLQTDLYRDLLAPILCRYATLLILAQTVRRIEVITIWRTIDQGPMEDDYTQFLHLLFPHIQKALEIRQVLGVANQRLAGAEAMANASPTATFLLTEQGRLLHHNAAADALLSDGNALTLEENTLVASNVQSRQALRSMLLMTATPSFTPSTPSPSHALALPRRDNRQPLQLLATPVPLTHRTHSGADLMLLVTDSEKSCFFPDNVLRTVYSLSAAETEIANGLLMGYSLGEIASLREVTSGTVRSQVKSLLSKTGTARQSDLVRLLMTLPAPPFTN
jgi:DNA-binding CsgD family transcriptional regulator